MTTHYEAALSCPACFQDLALALVEDGSDRRPRDGDQTVCSHCTAFLRYKEQLSLEGSHMGLAMIERDDYEELPEKDQIALMQVRNKLISLRAQGQEQQGAIAALMAREISRLKQRLHAVACGCLYCGSGDGLNCIRLRTA